MTSATPPHAPSVELMPADGGDRTTRTLPVVALCSLGLSLRATAVAPGGIFGALTNSLGASRVEASLLAASSTALFGIGALMGGLLVSRLGIMRSCIIACALCALGQAVRLAFTTTWMPFFGATCGALLGMGIGNAVIPELGRLAGGQRNRSIVLAYLVSMQLSMVVPPAATAWLYSSTDSLRIGLSPWLVPPAVGLFAFLVLALRNWGKPTSATMGAPRMTSSAASPNPAILFLLVAVFAATSLGTYATITFLPEFVPVGSSLHDHAGVGGSLFAGVGLVMSLLLPGVLNRIGRPDIIMAGCGVCWLVGCLLLAGSSGSLPWVGIILCGIGPGTFSCILVMLTTFDGFTTTQSSRIQGIGYLIAGSGPAAMPFWLALVGNDGVFATAPITIAVVVIIGASSLLSRVVPA